MGKGFEGEIFRRETQTEEMKGWKSMAECISRMLNKQMSA